MRSIASIRKASITAAMSMSIGHRVVQAWHEAHSQIACDWSTPSSWPRWTIRITWLGSRSISGPTGQPVEHLWHWKQAETGVPLFRSTSSAKAESFHSMDADMN